MSNFKSKNNFEKRNNESTNILKKYPDRIPIIVEKYKNSKINDIDKCKYLVPKDMTIGQFIYVIISSACLSYLYTCMLLHTCMCIYSSNLINQRVNKSVFMCI